MNKEELSKVFDLIIKYFEKDKRIVLFRSEVIEICKELNIGIEKNIDILSK